MARQSAAQKPSAIVLVNDPTQALLMTDTLAQRGMSVRIRTDPESLLSECRSEPPHLVIVEDRLATMTGARFLSDLLKISWTTSAIMICDEDEAAVHDKTEGLGILGSVRSKDDIASLNKLLNNFLDLS